MMRRNVKYYNFEELLYLIINFCYQNGNGSNHGNYCVIRILEQVLNNCFIKNIYPYILGIPLPYNL